MTIVLISTRLYYKIFMPSKQLGSTLGEFKMMLPCIIMYIVDTINGNGLSNGHDYIIISFLNHSLDIHGIAGFNGSD